MWTPCWKCGMYVTSELHEEVRWGPESPTYMVVPLALSFAKLDKRI